ncbi:MAG: type II/IV secretion system protein [Phycisphaera sp.]|nr:type II/IV secretion system protein [Phycisphaera sp.]
MAKGRRQLGHYLVRWGVITEEQLDEAIKLQQSVRKRLGELLVELSYATENDVARALSSQFNMEYVDLDTADHTELVAKVHANIIPREIIKKHLVLPLEKTNGRLKVLIHDPMDLELYDLLRFRLSCEIDTAIGAKKKIADLIDLATDERSSIDAEIRGISVDSAAGEDLGLEEGAEGEKKDSVDAADAPIVRLVHNILAAAIRDRASDIHIEPMADRVRLRYRIDGVCHVRDNLPKRMQNAVLARLKIMSGIKIDERRVPQDGRIKQKFSGANIDFRVSSCPAYHGESVVLRILRPDNVKVGLVNIGMEPDTLEKFNKAIKRPNGILLVTGPTGSGKTTTLYSALDVLNRPDTKIITAEDPVEYNFPGINQCQIRHDIGLDFARILRAMLRQAPNIVLVGEIRDREVADVAIEAALTGHLVFSTLHTNDAPGAITRLIDMGVKPFLVASSIQAVLAQRLVRVLCKECKEPDDNPKQFFLKLCGFTPQELEGQTLYRGVGCTSCSGSGFRGRKAVIEYMTMNSDIRNLAFKQAQASEIRKAAIANGMRDLVGDGKLKVLAGITTAEEVSKIAQVEGIVETEE